MAVVRSLRPMSHVRLYRANFVARLHRATKSQRATAQLHSATLSRKPNETNMTDDDILASSLVLVDRLAERKPKSSEKIRYGTISPFWKCVCEGGS